MKTKKISPTISGKEVQRAFELPTTQLERLRLSREHRQAYDAGMVDAYLNILKKIGTSEDLHTERLTFTEFEARNLCFQQLSALMKEKDKLRGQVIGQKRLLGEITQKHFDF